MTTEEIEKLLAWGEPEVLNTPRGQRYRRKAKDTPAFEALWSKQSNQLYASGLTRKRRGKTKYFDVYWWQHVPPEVAIYRQKTIAESLATDAEIVIPCRPGLSYLGYQKAGIKYAADREGTLLADEMGLGKTIQAIGLINIRPEIHRVLIIVPAHLKIKWSRELRKWLVRPQSVGIADGSCFPSTDIVIINFQILNKFPKRLEFYWDLVVVDEAHELRNPRSQRTKCVFGYVPNRKEKKEGMQMTSGIPAKRRMLLTGTPVANKPAELFPLINYLDPKTWPRKWPFYERYCGYLPVTVEVAKTRAEELQEKLRLSCMIRRLKSQVLKELPAKRREVIEFPAAKIVEVQRENDALSGFLKSIARQKANVELAKASGDMDAYKIAVEEHRKGVSLMSSDISSIRIETAMAKVPMAIEHVKPLIEEGNKVILFGFHREVVLQYHQAFKGSVMVRGGMSDHDKMRACDAFQNNDSCPMIVGNMSAMGTGLDLTAGNIVIFAEESWLPLEISQCEDRAHRIGQLNSVFVQHLVLEGSIDCRMAYRTIEKQEIADRILDPALADNARREPIIPMPEGVTVTLADIKRESEGVTEVQLMALNRAVQILNNVSGDAGGFNMVDAAIVQTMAGFFCLKPSQGVLAKRLASKYRQHLPESLAAQCVLDAPIAEIVPVQPVAPIQRPVRIEPPRPVYRPAVPTVQTAGQLSLF